MQRSLVIGASGLVGEYLVHSIADLGDNTIFTFRTYPIPSAEQLDICDASQVKSFFGKHRPEIVFLPASLTNVDYCEQNQTASYLTNVIGVKNIVEASNTINARLIYFSTDYIFDGSSGPYDEAAPASPISEYGRQKLMAEHYVALRSSDYLIIRTTVVYGWERRGKNFVFRLVKSLKENIPVKVATDQIGTPTYVGDLAKASVQLSKMDRQGVVNVSGADCISRYEFAVKAAQVFNLPEKLILPVTTSELGQPAARPLRAGLRTEKAQALLQTSFLSSTEGLLRMATDEQQLQCML